MSVYYCGYITHRDADEKVSEKKGGLSDHYLRHIQSCSTPLLMSKLDARHIKSSKFVQLSYRCYMLDGSHSLLTFTTDNKDLITLPQELDIQSIYPEPESDRVLLVVNENLSCSASQKIVAFHETFGKVEVLSLTDDKNKKRSIKKLSFGHSFSAILTEENELLKIDKCR